MTADATDLRHDHVVVDGTRLHVLEAGSSGDPVLLLHGFPQHAQMWHHVIPPLAQHHRVIAPDLRGAGASDAPRRGYGKAQLADEVVGLLDALGLDRVHVMGHDWGGYIGFLLALRHPNRVSSLIAVDAPSPWPDGSSLRHGWRFAYQPLLAAPVIGPALLRQPRFVRTLLRAGARRNPWSARDLEAYAQPYRDRARARAGSAMYRTFLTRELVPLLRGGHAADRLEMPALVLVGGADPVIRPELIVDHPHADQIAVEVIEGIGHFLPEERPDLVARRALRWFAAA